MGILMLGTFTKCLKEILFENDSVYASYKRNEKFENEPRIIDCFMFFDELDLLNSVRRWATTNAVTSGLSSQQVNLYNL